MNWSVMIVVGVIGVLVPVALVATFFSTRDSHKYACHYGQNGYSQEVQHTEEGNRKSRNWNLPGAAIQSQETEPAPESQLDSQNRVQDDNARRSIHLVEPLSEWPSEL